MAKKKSKKTKAERRAAAQTHGANVSSRRDGKRAKLEETQTRITSAFTWALAQGKKGDSTPEQKTADMAKAIGVPKSLLTSWMADPDQMTDIDEAKILTGLNALENNKAMGG